MVAKTLVKNQLFVGTMLPLPKPQEKELSRLGQEFELFQKISVMFINALIYLSNGG